VLLFGLLATLLVCGTGVAGLTWLWSSSSGSTVGEVDFDNRLAVPPLAPSRVDGAGRRVFGT
jgi:hypothetical protein